MESGRNYLSTGKAAKKLGITGVTLLEWIKAGKVQPDQVTEGGHNRFLPETIARLISDSRFPKEVCSAEEFLPFDLLKWMKEQVGGHLHSEINDLQMVRSGKNTVHFEFDIANRVVSVRSSTNSLGDCPFRTIKRRGDHSFILTVGYEFSPTPGQVIEGIFSFIDEGLSSVFFVLRRGWEPTFSSRDFLVHPLRDERVFWLTIGEHEFVLVLPKDPTEYQWRTFAAKCVVSPYAAKAKHEYHPPGFEFVEEG